MPSTRGLIIGIPIGCLPDAVVFPYQTQMDPIQEAFFQAVCDSIIAAAEDSSAEETPVWYTPESVIPGEYINGWRASNGSNHVQSSSALVPVSERQPLTLVRFEDPDANLANPGWYDLVTAPTCQRSLAQEDKQKKEWLCGGCRATFRSKYEAERHIATAGMKVRCRYCDKVVNGTTFVLKRHVGSTQCLRKWEERGFTGKRTVDGAFRA